LGKIRVIVWKTKTSPRKADFSSLEGDVKLSDENDFVDDEVCLEGMPYQKQNKDLFTQDLSAESKVACRLKRLGQRHQW